VNWRTTEEDVRNTWQEMQDIAKSYQLSVDSDATIIH
jgi:hypothetical protein